MDVVLQYQTSELGWTDHMDVFLYFNFILIKDVGDFQTLLQKMLIESFITTFGSYHLDTLSCYQMSVTASKPTTNRLSTQQDVQGNSGENIEAAHYRPLMRGIWRQRIDFPYKATVIRKPVPSNDIVMVLQFECNVLGWLHNCIFISSWIIEFTSCAINLPCTEL